MSASLALLFALASRVADAAPPSTAPQPIAAGSVIDWNAVRDGDPKSYALGRLTITLSSRVTADGRAPTITVSSPQSGATSVQGQVGFPNPSARLVVEKLDPEAKGAAVIFATYTGGAHCCTAYDVLDPVGRGWSHVEAGEWDGDGLTKAPRDIDGDGAPDIVQRDDAFLYAFASYADSWAPPRVFDMVGARMKDVSASGRFASIYRADMADAGNACSKHFNGACAAYVADAGRLGEIDAAWRTMLASYDRQSTWLPDRCDAPLTKGGCPKGREHHWSGFPDALAWFLVQNGYATSGTFSHLVPKLDSAAGPLVPSG